MRIVQLTLVSLEELQRKKQALETQVKITGLPEETQRLERELKDLDAEIKTLQNKSGYQKHDKLTEKTLQPVNKVNSELDKELQEWEVESTKDGQDSQGNG